jgi:hypothetical protein
MHIHPHVAILLCGDIQVKPKSRKLCLHLTSTSGNTLSDASGKTYTCDFENRLIQAVVPGQNGGTTTFK